MMEVQCLDDASYVLGALTPAERREFRAAPGALLALPGIGSPAHPGAVAAHADRTARRPGPGAIMTTP